VKTSKTKMPQQVRFKSN